jgi:hypothetical protein
VRKGRRDAREPGKGELTRMKGTGSIVSSGRDMVVLYRAPVVALVVAYVNSIILALPFFSRPTV